MWMNQYQPPSPPKPPQFRGTWVMASSYQEALGIPVPMDGTPILVMLSDEQKFYLVSMQNGQRMISAFSFNALSVPTEPVTPAAPNDIEARLSRLEEMIGGLANESHSKDTAPVSAAARHK